MDDMDNMDSMDMGSMDGMGEMQMAFKFSCEVTLLFSFLSSGRGECGSFLLLCALTCAFCVMRHGLQHFAMRLYVAQEEKALAEEEEAVLETQKTQGREHVTAERPPAAGMAGDEEEGGDGGSEVQTDTESEGGSSTDGSESNPPLEHMAQPVTHLPRRGRRMSEGEVLLRETTRLSMQWSAGHGRRGSGIANPNAAGYASLNNHSNPLNGESGDNYNKKATPGGSVCDDIDEPEEVDRVPVSTRILRTLFYVVTFTISMSVMLAAMTFNAGIMLSLMLGEAIGFGIFGSDNYFMHTMTSAH